MFTMLRTDCNPHGKGGRESASVKYAQDTTNVPEWKIKARQMVSDQIIARDVKDARVIRVMESTPRHLFVPKEYERLAYTDRPLPIGEGQTISQPYIVALMTELLALKGKEKVLEIGTGSGYQAAILSQLTDSVYTIEIVKPLADSAKSRLQRLGYKNVVVKWGDGYQGWTKYAPFDGIIVTAAPDEIPPKLIEQLKVGGRMVVPVGNFYQNLLLITKTKSGIKQENIAPVIFVPMIHPKEPVIEEK